MSVSERVTNGGGSLAEGQGAPVPDGPGTRDSGFPGPGGLVHVVTPLVRTPDPTPEPDSGRAKRGRGGRPKRYGKPLNVPLTPEQRVTVDALAALWRCGAAEAIRRVLDGVAVPEPVERVAVDEARYEKMMAALAAIRTPVNRVNGDLYRLTRDSYKGVDPLPEELDALTAELVAVRAELGVVAHQIAGLSPW